MLYLAKWCLKAKKRHLLGGINETIEYILLLSMLHNEYSTETDSLSKNCLKLKGSCPIRTSVSRDGAGNVPEYFWLLCLSTVV